MSLLEVLLLVVGVVIIVVDVVFVFVVLELVVVLEVVIVIIGISISEFELIGPKQDEALAALRTAQSVTFIVVLGVDLVEFAFGTGRHASAPRSGIGRAR